jgi:uncharacterized protein (DUF1697 family)
MRPGSAGQAFGFTTAARFAISRSVSDLHILLLRAINVGGHGRVAMAELVALLEGLGLQRPRSLLHAGSFVLGAGNLGCEALESLVEHEIEARLGLATQALARSAHEWDAVLSGNPFRDEARDAPAKLMVMPLKAEPAPGAFETLQTAHTGPERAALVGRTLYIVYPEGAGASKFTGALIERKLGVRGTARNWNTAVKLKALADAEGSQTRP